MDHACSIQSPYLEGNSNSESETEKLDSRSRRREFSDEDAGSVYADERGPQLSEVLCLRSSSTSRPPIPDALATQNEPLRDFYGRVREARPEDWRSKYDATPPPPIPHRRRRNSGLQDSDLSKNLKISKKNVNFHPLATALRKCSFSDSIDNAGKASDRYVDQDDLSPERTIIENQMFMEGPLEYIQLYQKLRSEGRLQSVPQEVQDAYDAWEEDGCSENGRNVESVFEEYDFAQESPMVSQFLPTVTSSDIKSPSPTTSVKYLMSGALKYEDEDDEDDTKHTESFQTAQHEDFENAEQLHINLKGKKKKKTRTQSPDADVKSTPRCSSTLHAEPRCTTEPCRKRSSAPESVTGPSKRARSLVSQDQPSSQDSVANQVLGVQEEGTSEEIRLKEKEERRKAKRERKRLKKEQKHTPAIKEEMEMAASSETVDTSSFTMGHFFNHTLGSCYTIPGALCENGQKAFLLGAVLKEMDSGAEPFMTMPCKKTDDSGECTYPPHVFKLPPKSANRRHTSAS